MGQNSTEVAYQFGQMGSTYTTASSDAIKPPTGKVFVSILTLDDTVFDSSGGLVAEKARGISVAGIDGKVHVQADVDIYVSTDAAANDSGTANAALGEGGKNLQGVTFPVGVTIYGRWTEIDVSSGSIIAYIGE